MTVGCLLIIISIIIVLVGLILFAGKKCCDMAIKTEVARKYSNLIFTPEQKDAIDKTNDESIKWLQKNGKETEIISKDGLKLRGYEVKQNPKSNVWVIAVHGYMGRGWDMVQYVKKFIEWGYNGLIIDLRAHGNSEGKYIGMGWLDHYDLEMWIDKIIEENNDCKIVLYGISMGAATVSMTTGENIPQNVKVAIADCGYTTVWDEFKVHLMRIIHVLPFPLLYAASAMSKIFAGYRFKEASTIKQVKKSRTPTLFIHGTKDKFVPYSMLNHIYEAASCKKEKLEIEDAAHAESYNINPHKYWGTIQKFIKNYI